MVAPVGNDRNVQGLQFIQNTFDRLGLGTPNMFKKLKPLSVVAAKSKSQTQTHTAVSYNHRQTSQVNQNVSSNASKSASQTQNHKNGFTKSTHIDYSASGALNKTADTFTTRDTEKRVTTYDKNGQATGEKYSRQQVNVAQSVNVNQTTQTDGSRDINQSSFTVRNPNLVNTHTTYSDVDKGTTLRSTQTTTDTATNVRNLDEQGNVLSDRSSAQRVLSDSQAQTDYSRTYERDTQSHTRVDGNTRETGTQSKYTYNNQTSTQVNTNTQVENYDGAGNPLNVRNLSSQSNTVTSDIRDGHTRSTTAVTKEDGVTTTVQAIDTRETRDINTDITTSVNGGEAKTREIDSNSVVNVEGNITTVAQGNNKTVQFDATKTVRSSSTDSNGTREVKTKSDATTTFDGTLELAAEQAAASASAGVVVEVGSFTGVRSAFKFDNGTLKFDFTVERDATSSQDVTQGGTTTSSESASKESVHFSGEIVTSVAEDGTKTFTIKANASSSSLAGKYTGPDGNPTSAQAEQKATELQIEGKLNVNRTSTTNGNTTTTNVVSSGELNVNKVETTEAAGVNVTTLTPLADKGLSAGFSVHNGALSFNFGNFDFKLRTVA